MKAWKYIAEGFVSVFTFNYTSSYKEEGMESFYKELINAHKEMNRKYDQEVSQLIKQYKKSQRVSKDQMRGLYAGYKK